MDLRIQASLLAAVVSGALAASVLLRSRKRRDQWLFGLFGLNMSFWYLTTFLSKVVPGAAYFGRANLAFGVLLPLSAVEFFRTFMVAGDAQTVRLKRAARACALALLLVVASPFYEGLFVRTAVLAYVLVFLGAALLMLYLRARETKSRFEGGRRYFLAFVGGLAGIFTLFEYLPYVGVDLPPVGTILTLLFLYMLSQSVVRLRLIDLYELAARLAVLTTLSFALGAILWVLVTFGGSSYVLQAVVASLVVLVLFDPLRSKVSDKLAQFLFRERYDFEATIAELRRQLAHVIEAGELKDVLLGGLESSRRVTHAALYLADEGQYGYELAGHIGPAPMARVEMAPARPLLERLRESNALTLENLERLLEEHREQGEDREAETLFEAAQCLSAMNGSVALALRSDEGELYGLLALRDDRMRDAFSPEEVALLVGLATQVAIAIDNARLYQRLRERDRLASLGEMAAGLAHEIRNPLGAIKASAQYLTDGDGGDGDEFLGIIVEEVDRLNRVVGSFLDYARPATGNAAPLDIAAAVQRTAQLLSPQCTEAGVLLELALSENLPAVRIDAEQLRQVLLNLVQNAIHALDGRKGASICIGARKGRSRGRDTVILSVEDNGPGIAEDVQRRLFVPFVTTKDRGTGLGLAISQRIAGAAAGRLQVRSTLGQGSTFYLTLPAVRPAPDAERDHSSLPADVPRAAPSTASAPRSPSAPPLSAPSGVTTSR
ncbi:MAG: ATP-binding protein [Myxococcota bacterium]